MKTTRKKTTTVENEREIVRCDMCNDPTEDYNEIVRNYRVGTSHGSPGTGYDTYTPPYSGTLYSTDYPTEKDDGVFHLCIGCYEMLMGDDGN